jgi:hypothetical protein
LHIFPFMYNLFRLYSYERGKTIIEYTNRRCEPRLVGAKQSLQYNIITPPRI